MAWRQISNKPFSEPMVVQFTDAYMRQYSSGELFMRTGEGYFCVISRVPQQRREWTPK